MAAGAAGALAIYQRFMSDSAKKCNHLGGATKTICMYKYKIHAATAMLKAAETKYDKEVWQQKLTKYRAKLNAASIKLKSQR
jgi:hypothetical protein